MLEWTYRRFSRRMVLVVFGSLPWLLLMAMQLNPANDVETWMPESDASRVAYEEFKQAFGVEEFVLVAFDRHAQGSPDDRLIESVCARLERLPEVRHCWSAGRMAAIMQSLGVNADEVQRRICGLLSNQTGGLWGMVAMLSEQGRRNRSAAVAAIRHELSYCQLDHDKSLLAGSPMFVTELDRLGSKQANTAYFVVTLGICLGILYWLIGEWKLTGLVFGLTVWTINATIVLLHLAGVEINPLLSCIPVLVMVLTMAISVHYLYYYQEALAHGSANPLLEGLRAAWWPTLIGTLTTCLGELALSVSDIVPIRHFAYAATAGSALSMAAGLGLTPALVAVCPMRPRAARRRLFDHARLAGWIVARARPLAAATLLTTLLACGGLARLRSDMNIIDFLPSDSKVRQDFLRIEKDLAPVNSVEAIVAFDDLSLPFVERLARVRSIERKIRQHPAVVQTLSLASFFPDPMPQDPLAVARILRTALDYRVNNEFAADGESTWRISARLRLNAAYPWQQVARDLERLVAGQNVTFTGLAVLVDGAQREIFSSFWQSIAVALALITALIVVFLRSLRVGLTAMIPNLAPLCWVYGLLGWLDWPIDIAMMLSGSIALGLSVDGTYHFILHFRQHWARTGCPDQATRGALVESSIPFSQATLTAMAGMLGLTLSSFAPTARFGWLMIALLLAALAGDVIMLPAMVRMVCGQRRSPPAQVPRSAPANALERAA